MAAVSIGLLRGADGFKRTDFTIGSSAPTGGQDIELRYNTTDQNAAAMTRKDVHIALEAFIRLLKEAGVQVPAGTFTLPDLGV